MSRSRTLTLAVCTIIALVAVTVWTALGLWDGVTPRRLATSESTAGDPLAESRSATVAALATTIATEARRAPTSRVAVAEDPGCHLLFVSAADAQPLDVDVAITLTGDPPLVETALRGRVALHDRRGSAILTARAPGFVAASGRLVLDVGVNRIALVPAGEVRLRCADAEGSPVQGVEAVLLPPSLGRHAEAVYKSFGASAAQTAPETPAPFEINGDRWTQADGDVPPHGGWRARSDAAGMITWRGVGPGDGYRWALLPPLRGILDPPHERRRFTPTDAGVEVRRAPPASLSGRFAVLAGDVVDCAVSVHASSHVFGRVVGATILDAAAVKLYRIRQHAGAGSRPVTAFDLEYTGRSDELGSFRFDDVAPGIYALRACWRSSPDDLHFANQTFQVDAGGDVDLATIRATAGGTADVELTITDELGHPMALERVFSTTERTPTVSVVCELLPDSGVATDMVYETVTLPFGRRFSFHGLPPGRLAIHTLADPSGPQIRPDVDELRPPERHMVRTEAMRPIDLRFVVRRGFQREFIAALPGGRPVPAPGLWVRLQRGGEAIHRRLREGEGTGSLVLAAGEYDLWCAMEGVDATHTGYWASARATFGPGHDAPIVLQLEAAAAVRLTICDEANVPLPGAKLAFTPGDGWPAFYAAEGDRHGEARLTGLPPGRLLHMPDGGSVIPPLEAGSFHEVTLNVRRRAAPRSPPPGSRSSDVRRVAPSDHR